MKKLFFLTALLCASVMSFATQYCDEPLTLSGGAEIQLSCISPSAGHYQIIIKGTDLNGLGGSFYNPGAVDLRTKITSSTSTMIVCDIEAESAPALYTPLYVNCPGEQNINWPNDIEWGVCSTGKTDPELTINATETTLDAAVPETFQIVANKADGAGAISYESSNAGVASVNDEGLVTAVGRGTAIITVRVAENETFAAASKKLTVTVNGDINWDAIAWVPNSNNKFKVFAAEGQNVDVVQHPGFADEDGIYTTFPAGINSCSLGDGKYAVQGAGIVLYLSAFTAQVTEVTVTADGADYVFYVYYADGGTATAISHVADGAKAIKMIEDGKLIIIKNGVRYDATGQVIR